MERERQQEERRQRIAGGAGPPGGDGLDQAKTELDGLLDHADQVFDSIGHIDAQDYLHQNIQTGGQ